MGIDVTVLSLEEIQLGENLTLLHANNKSADQSAH